MTYYFRIGEIYLKGQSTVRGTVFDPCHVWGLFLALKRFISRTFHEPQTISFNYSILDLITLCIHQHIVKIELFSLISVCAKFESICRHLLARVQRSSDRFFTAYFQRNYSDRRIPLQTYKKSCTDGGAASNSYGYVDNMPAKSS